MLRRAAVRVALRRPAQRYVWHEGKMEEQRAEEIAAEIKKLRDDAGKAFREAVEREKVLLQEYEKLTDQPFDDE